ncbi:MAG: TonB C-terminal domain-containing protein [Sulfuricella sp.]|jgi:outer membrane biosynthesis protein TonB
MSKQKKRISRKQVLFIVAGMGLTLLCLMVLAFNSMFSAPKRQHKKPPQMVSLLPPPPPPPKQEQIQPQEKLEEKTAEKMEQLEPLSGPEQESAEAPPAQDLGVDAEGTAGGDNFGLVGRKGGRGLLAGGGGGTGYGWYTNRISVDLQRMVNEIIQKEGGLPEGKWRTVVKIELEVTGKIKTFSIIGSSGNQKLDAAVNKALASANLTESLPPGMPRIMKLSFTI